MAHITVRHDAIQVSDIPLAHPSVSSQHAVIQFRAVPEMRDGATVTRVKPYIIDLNRCDAGVCSSMHNCCSANGTMVNSQKIEPQRYYELREKDVLKFGAAHH